MLGTRKIETLDVSTSKTAIISVPKCKALLFIIEASCVFCEMRTESLYIKLFNFCLHCCMRSREWSSYAGRAVMTLQWVRTLKYDIFFYVHVTVHRYKFLNNKTN